jgi:hypothetical protein
MRALALIKVFMPLEVAEPFRTVIFWIGAEKWGCGNSGLSAKAAYLAITAPWFAN